MTLGDLEALLVDGAIRRLRYRGVEVVRGMDCPIRDPNWGTATPANVEEQLRESEDGIVFFRTFSVFDGALSAKLTYHFSFHGVKADLKLAAHRRIETNRAGFTLLHPIQGVAGTDLIIQHSDGSEERTSFPELISPGQPAFDMVGMNHRVGGISVDIRFSGEIFEMEDQRNWTDASYKTYCRPLGLPFPYAIEAGETVEQSIEISFAQAYETTRAVSARNGTAEILPDVALAIEPGWMSDTAKATLTALPAARRLLRIDAAASDIAPLIAGLEGPVELEVVINDTGDAAAGLKALADNLRSSGIDAQSLIALPRAYLQSYQPTGQWPTGHGIADAARWAQGAFPDAQVGVGMLTNFTEFNRHPPPKDIGDFTTYSTTAIVHAGDDLSVFETLEALSHVHASARALSGNRSLRLGLATIGMRSNPYGAAVADNPDLQRIAMAMDDPRQQTAFAAAFAVGAYVVAAKSGCARIALAGAGGPFATGQITNGAFQPWPIHHVLDVLTGFSGMKGRQLPDLPDEVLGVTCDGAAPWSGLIANCSTDPKRLSLPGRRGVVLNGAADVAAPDWLSRAEPQALDNQALAPAAVVFLAAGGA